METSTKVIVYDLPNNVYLSSASMNEKIWRNLSQILYHRNDLIGRIKPFFENLKNKNITDKKYISFLKTISIYQLKNLYQHNIITNEVVKTIIGNNYHFSSIINQKSKFHIDNLELRNKIEKIISGDKIKDFQELILEGDFNEFKTIIILL